MKKLSQQDEKDIINELSAKVNNLLSESTSGTDFQSKLEKDNFKTIVACQDDGIASLTGDEDEEVEPYAKPTENVQQNINILQPKAKSEGCKIYQFNQAGAQKEVERDMKQNKAYFETTADAQPATVQDINNTIADVDLAEIEKNLYKEYDKIMEKETQAFKNHRKAAIESKKTEWASDKIGYVKNTYDYKGEPKEFQMAVQRVNWGEILAKDATTPDLAIERLRSFVTYNIKKYYGGWNRIQTIVVRDQQLIINNVCYMPAIEKEHLNANIFPLDTIDYIRNGCMAQFFNWKVLKQMNHLHLIDIDDVNFFTTYVADDLELGRRIGVSSLFRIVPSLDELIIGDESITLESLNTPASVPIKQKVATSKRFLTFSDNYKVNIYGISNGIQDYMFNNLKTYANNRGNKGLFRFCCGTLARAGLTGVAGVLNFGAHLGGAIIQTIKHSFTPISESEIYNNPEQ